MTQPVEIFLMIDASEVGLPISYKKLFRGRRNRRNNGLFWRNSGCSAEQKILGISLRTVLQRRKMLGILYHRTKLEANAHNSVLNHFAEEKTTRNSVPWNKTISKHLEFRSEPFRGRDNNSEFCSKACLGWKHAVNSVCRSRIFCKTNFFQAISFRSELRNRLSRKLRNASEWALSSAE